MKDEQIHQVTKFYLLSTIYREADCDTVISVTVLVTNVSV